MIFGLLLASGRKYGKDSSWNKEGICPEIQKGFFLESWWDFSWNPERIYPEIVNLKGFPLESRRYFFLTLDGCLLEPDRIPLLFLALRAGSEYFGPQFIICTCDNDIFSNSHTCLKFISFCSKCLYHSRDVVFFYIWYSRLVETLKLFKLFYVRNGCLPKVFSLALMHESDSGGSDPV